MSSRITSHHHLVISTYGVGRDRAHAAIRGSACGRVAGRAAPPVASIPRLAASHIPSLSPNACGQLLQPAFCRRHFSQPVMSWCCCSMRRVVQGLPAAPFEPGTFPASKALLAFAAAMRLVSHLIQRLHRLQLRIQCFQPAWVGGDVAWGWDFAPLLVSVPDAAVVARFEILSRPQRWPDVSGRIRPVSQEVSGRYGLSALKLRGGMQQGWWHERTRHSAPPWFPAWMVPFLGSLPWFPALVPVRFSCVHSVPDVSAGGSLTQGEDKPDRQVAPWDLGNGVHRRGGGQVEGLTASAPHPPQPHHQPAGLPFTGWSGEWVGRPAAGVSGASQALRALVEGRPATCVTHGSPDAARCEDAPESTITGARAATLCATGEGVTLGGQSIVGVGLHAAEALTPSSSRQAVRGQDSRTGGGSLTR